jgi:dTDP-4-amino-4,6-dideoxygalactose transaminase
MGEFGCFSFYPSKNLGGFGDGGMVTTNDPALADKLKLLRNLGYGPKYYNRIIGWNFRLDALQAAVLRVKLNYLDSWTAARQRNASLYRRLFAEAGVAGQQVELPAECTNGRHIYNQFVIRHKARNRLLIHLQAHGIGTEIYYPVPLHLQECYGDLGYQAGAFPASESAANESLALPIYPELTPDMIQSVVSRIAEFR